MPTDNPGRSAEFISLRDYMESKFVALEKALDLAYRQMETRLEGMNEFRQSLRDQSQTFVIRSEFGVFKEKVDLDLNNICKEIKDLQLSRAELSGKATQNSVNNTMIIAIIGLVIGILGIVMGILGV